MNQEKRKINCAVVFSSNDAQKISEVLEFLRSWDGVFVYYNKISNRFLRIVEEGV